MNEQQPIELGPLTRLEPLSSADYVGLSHSPSIANIAAALAAAQGQMEGAKKDSANPFFSSRYADLASIIGSIRAPLAANKIAHIQNPGSDEQGTFVDSMLIHASGEWFRGRIRMNIPKIFHKESREWMSGDTPQGRGSVITYMRRYALQAMVGLEAEDDDGNEATRRNDHDDRPWRESAPKTKPLTPGSFQTPKTVDLPKQDNETLPEANQTPNQESSEEVKITNWKDVVCHAGKKGGAVIGKRLGDLSDLLLNDIAGIYRKKAVKSKDDAILKAALAMYEAEKKPSLSPIDQLAEKCKEDKIDIEIMRQIAVKAANSKAKDFFDITETEIKFLMDNWKETVQLASEMV